MYFRTDPVGTLCRTGCRLSAAGSRCDSTGAKNAVERLYALAHALVNDYERFERLVDGRGEAGGAGEVVKR